MVVALVAGALLFEEYYIHTYGVLCTTCVIYEAFGNLGLDIWVFWVFWVLGVCLGGGRFQVPDCWFRRIGKEMGIGKSEFCAQAAAASVNIRVRSTYHTLLHRAKLLYCY